jgi:hypothetical protein
MARTPSPPGPRFHSSPRYRDNRDRRRCDTRLRSLIECTDLGQGPSSLDTVAIVETAALVIPVLGVALHGGDSPASLYCCLWSDRLYRTATPPTGAPPMVRRSARVLILSYRDSHLTVVGWGVAVLPCLLALPVYK